MRIGLSTALLFGIVLPLALPAHAAGEAEWKETARAEGFVAMQRDKPGRSFPTYRGRGIVEASILDLLAILSDVKRHPEWMSHNAESRLLKQVSEYEYYVYSRTAAPWPVSDRDAVYHAAVVVDRSKKTVHVNFWAVSGFVAPVRGVVRMRRLQGIYSLHSLGPKRTLLDFEIDADPEGMIPKWVARIATRDVPIETARRIRKQLAKTRGWYAERIKRWTAIAPELLQP
jgi:hypothetical protein